MGQALAENLASSNQQLLQPRLTPDGSEILYISKSTDLDAPESIYAIPIGGGPPRLVLQDQHIWNVQCAQLPSGLCLYSTQKDEHSETFRFDVKTGKDSAPPQIDPICSWSLSPDGSRRAIILYAPEQSTIRFRSTKTGETREINVKGWKGLGSPVWSAEGTSLLVSWQDQSRNAALLSVSMGGKASVLFRTDTVEILGAIPSPDGRWLAMVGGGGIQNVFQLENFR
jgi:Tol biopolymer transport system component